MGVIQLPTYEAEQIETHKVREQHPEFEQQARLGQAQAGMFGTLVEGGEMVAGLALKARNQRDSDEMSKLMLAREDWKKSYLREMEKHPIDPSDIRYQELPEDQRELPNAAAFERDEALFMDNMMEGVTNERVKNRLQAYRDEMFIAEKDGVSKWDWAKTKEIRYDNLMEGITAAVEAGDVLLADRLAEMALADDTITQVQFDDYLDLAHKDVTKKGLFNQALALGDGTEAYEVASPLEMDEATGSIISETPGAMKRVERTPSGLEFLQSDKNLEYTTYDGAKKAMPEADKKQLIDDYLAATQKSDEAIDQKYSSILIAAWTKEAVWKALKELQGETVFKGETRYKWEERLVARLRYLDSLENVPSGGKTAIEKAQEANQDYLNYSIEVALYNGDVNGARRLIDDAVNENKVTRTWAGQKYKDLKTDKDPRYDMAFGELQKAFTKSKLSASDKTEMGIAFERWWRSKPTPPTDKEIKDAVSSLMAGKLTDAVNKWSEAVGVLKTAESGGFEATAQMNSAILAGSAAWLKDEAKKVHPELDLMVPYVDEDNTFGLGVGHPFFWDSSLRRLYTYQIVDGKPVLKMNAKHRDNSYTDNSGQYIWNDVDKPLEVTAEDRLNAEEAAAELAADEENPTMAMVVPINGVATQVNFMDYSKNDKGQWVGKKSGTLAPPMVQEALNQMAKNRLK